MISYFNPDCTNTSSCKFVILPKVLIGLIPNTKYCIIIL